MPDWLRNRTQQIGNFIRQWLSTTGPQLQVAGNWGEDITQRLADYSTSGKMIRGALVLLAHQIYSGDNEPAALRAAAAMELLQTFLLIHDDIMDEDDTRRGQPSMHQQYHHEGSRLGMARPKHFGLAMAICLGDIAQMCAMELLAEGLQLANINARRQTMLLLRIAREIALVGVAQMDDISFSLQDKEIDVEQVLALYRYKTGRYTFALPLTIGAALARDNPTDQAILTALGERLGIVFQIRDDYLELFGDSQTIGKPTGSDISSNKKTIYRQLLFQLTPPEQHREISALFGAENPKQHQLEQIRQLVRSSGAAEAAEQLLRRHTDEAAALLAQLPAVDQEGRQVLAWLLQYNATRQR